MKSSERRRVAARESARRREERAERLLKESRSHVNMALLREGRATTMIEDYETCPETVELIRYRAHLGTECLFKLQLANDSWFLAAMKAVYAFLL